MPSASLRVRMLARVALSSRSLEACEADLGRLLGGRHAVLFASARGALAAAVAVTVRPDGTVQLPAYTCVAVPNAVRSADCQPAWADVDGLGRPRFGGDGVEAVITQDTYGFPCPEPPADVPVIRDASHRADLVFTGGGRAAVTVTSFEHSKSLSAGLGGLAVTGNAAIADEMRERRDERPGPGSSLRHVAATLAGLLSGRALFRGARAAGLALDRLAAAIDRDRMRGQDALETAGYGVSMGLLGRPSPAAAELMVAQLSAYQRAMEHRSRIVAAYDAAFGIKRAPLPLVRYPLVVSDRDRTLARFREAGWELRPSWFEGLVHPQQADPLDFGLRPADFPVASELAAHAITLPTHPLVTSEDAAALARLAVAADARPLTAD